MALIFTSFRKVLITAAVFLICGPGRYATAQSVDPTTLTLAQIQAELDIANSNNNIANASNNIANSNNNIATATNNTATSTNNLANKLAWANTAQIAAAGAIAGVFAAAAAVFLLKYGGKAISSTYHFLVGDLDEDKKKRLIATGMASFESLSNISKDIVETRLAIDADFLSFARKAEARKAAVIASEGAMDAAGAIEAGHAIVEKDVQNSVQTLSNSGALSSDELQQFLKAISAASLLTDEQLCVDLANRYQIWSVANAKLDEASADILHNLSLILTGINQEAQRSLDQEASVRGQNNECLRSAKKLDGSFNDPQRLDDCVMAKTIMKGIDSERLHAEAVSDAKIRRRIVLKIGEDLQKEDCAQVQGSSMASGICLDGKPQSRIVGGLKETMDLSLKTAVAMCSQNNPTPSMRANSIFFTATSVDLENATTSPKNQAHGK